jgi:hypothetical protein
VERGDVCAVEIIVIVADDHLLIAIRKSLSHLDLDRSVFASSSSSRKCSVDRHRLDDFAWFAVERSCALVVVSLSAVQSRAQRLSLPRPFRRS